MKLIARIMKATEEVPSRPRGLSAALKGALVKRTITLGVDEDEFELPNDGSFKCGELVEIEVTKSDRSC